MLRAVVLWYFTVVYITCASLTLFNQMTALSAASLRQSRCSLLRHTYCVCVFLCAFKADFHAHYLS